MLNKNLDLNENIFKTEPDRKHTRDGYINSLLELAEQDKSIVVLDADLSESTKTYNFKKKFPDNFVQMGIAEQNMAGVAAGLALSGKKPFINSFAIFSPGRNWEQIRLSICMSNANVKIVSSHAGLSHSFDGGMAQCLEDIALMRVLPNMTVICPTDYYEAYKATKAAAKTMQPTYIRLERGDTEVITTAKTPFKIGEAQILKTGTDLTIIATGPIVYEALVAAKELKEKHNIDAEVINCATVKPLDEKTLVTSAKKTKKVVTVENHQRAGGLGSAVAELLSEQCPVPVLRLGMDDKFGESGTYVGLKEKYGLDAKGIAKCIIKTRSDS